MNQPLFQDVSYYAIQTKLSSRDPEQVLTALRSIPRLPPRQAAACLKVALMFREGYDDRAQRIIDAFASALLTHSLQQNGSLGAAEGEEKKEEEETEEEEAKVDYSKMIKDVLEEARKATEAGLKYDLALQTQRLGLEKVKIDAEAKKALEEIKKKQAALPATAATAVSKINPAAYKKGKMIVYFVIGGVVVVAGAAAIYMALRK